MNGCFGPVFHGPLYQGQKLDIIYNNIKHAFFQPAESEALVILHFNLYHPIVIGKRKTTDVQFVQETMEV